MASETPLSDVRFLTVAEVALIMRVSKMTVYRLVHSGELEAIRVGRSFRVPEAAVNQYLRAAFVGTGLSRPEFGLLWLGRIPVARGPAGLRMRGGTDRLRPGRLRDVPSRGPRFPGSGYGRDRPP